MITYGFSSVIAVNIHTCVRFNVYINDSPMYVHNTDYKWIQIKVEEIYSIYNVLSSRLLIE